MSSYAWAYTNSPPIGEQCTVKLNGITLYSLAYSNDLISSISYGDNRTYTFAYNSDDLLEEVKYNNSAIVNYEYDGFMRVNKITSHSSSCGLNTTI